MIKIIERINKVLVIKETKYINSRLDKSILYLQN